MKQILIQYASYNYWANRIILETLARVPHDVLVRENGSSFGNIYNTVVHMMETESIWWQRLKLKEHVELPEKDPGQHEEAISGALLAQSTQWKEWVSGANDKIITHVFEYQNTRKKFFKQPVYEMLMHLFNHQSYHRGQIVTMLRQAGIDKIPATDFIAFCRKK